MNDSPYQFKSGDCLSVFINQGDREACVLAAIGDEVLVEYEMPSGSTALYAAHRETPETPKRSVSYRTLPRKWRQAIIAAGQGWIGRPQQCGELLVQLLEDGRVVGYYGKKGRGDRDGDYLTSGHVILEA